MTRPEVEQAFLTAKNEAIGSVSIGEVQEMVRFKFPSGNPFNKVNLRIAKGELSMGDPLEDFLAMEYGIDFVDQVKPFYEAIEEGIRRHPGELVAVVVKGGDSSSEMYREINPFKNHGWVEVGILKGASLTVDLQSGSSKMQGSDDVDQYFPSLSVPVEGMGMISYPQPLLRRRQPNSYPGYTSLHIHTPNFLSVDGEVTVNPIPQVGGSTLWVGNVDVQERLRHARLGKVLEIVPPPKRA